MLSDELRNLALWLRARRKPVEISVIVHMLEELVLEAERLEANTRLTGEELAEQLSIEGLPR
jgi:hypothetical protein